jgi:hypothetical protein
MVDTAQPGRYRPFAARWRLASDLVPALLKARRGWHCLPAGSGVLHLQAVRTAQQGRCSKLTLAGAHALVHALLKAQLALITGWY